MRSLKWFPGLCGAALAAALPLGAQVYTTVDPPIAIPDNSGGTVTACQTINVPPVPGGDTIGTAIVSTSVTHTWVGDLTIELRNPSSNNLTVLNRPGRFGAGFGNPANLASTTAISYDDAATQSAEDEGENPPGIACGSATDVGLTCGPSRYIPAPNIGDTPFPGVGTNLAQYTGTQAFGAWTLCAADSAAGDTGILTSWSLVFTGNTPVELQSLEVK